MAIALALPLQPRHWRSLYSYGTVARATAYYSYTALAHALQLRHWRTLFSYTALAHALQLRHWRPRYSTATALALPLQL